MAIFDVLYIFYESKKHHEINFMVLKFFGNSLEILWKFFGNSLGILWEFFGNSLEILWEFFGNSLEISEAFSLTRNLFSSWIWQVLWTFKAIAVNIIFFEILFLIGIFSFFFSTTNRWGSSTMGKGNHRWDGFSRKYDWKWRNGS